MLSIPAEVLPRFCATPRSVAALALTCAELAARLRQYRPIFKIVRKCCTMVAAESVYYGCGLYTDDGIVTRETVPPDDCRSSCQPQFVRSIVESAAELLMRSADGTVVICRRPDIVFDVRCRKFTVYQLHQVLTVPRCWFTRDIDGPVFIALSTAWRYSSLNDYCAENICLPGTLVYKRISDCFFCCADYQLHKK